MNYYNEIKNELVNNEITKRVKTYSINRSDLNAYYNVGKILSEAGKHYGEGIIREYSNKLTCELGKGYTPSSLKRFRQFFMLIEKGATMSHQLTWGHYSELIVLKDVHEVNYYIGIIEVNSLSIRQLRERIKSNEYKRLDEETRSKLINNEQNTVMDFVKNPIIIRNGNNYEVISEKILQKLILEDISSFMKELGEGFSFIDNEYKIKVGNTYNYIDLLLYNIKYRCYVVIELKVVNLSYNHTGQIQNYMNYVDMNIKDIDDNKTVGIIICKQNNRYIIDYCSDKRIIAREYKII